MLDKAERRGGHRRARFFAASFDDELSQEISRPSRHPFMLAPAPLRALPRRRDLGMPEVRPFQILHNGLTIRHQAFLPAMAKAILHLKLPAARSSDQSKLVRLAALLRPTPRFLAHFAIHATHDGLLIQAKGYSRPLESCFIDLLANMAAPLVTPSGTLAPERPSLIQRATRRMHHFLDPLAMAEADTEAASVEVPPDEMRDFAAHFLKHHTRNTILVGNVDPKVTHLNSLTPACRNPPPDQLRLRRLPEHLPPGWHPPHRALGVCD